MQSSSGPPPLISAAVQPRKIKPIRLRRARALFAPTMQRERAREVRGPRERERVSTGAEGVMILSGVYAGVLGEGIYGAPRERLQQLFEECVRSGLILSMRECVFCGEERNGLVSFIPHYINFIDSVIYTLIARIRFFYFQIRILISM